MSNIGGVIKSIRDIFRKDPGLSGDAQRIEQLGWMIFLKLFDDKQRKRTARPEIQIGHSRRIARAHLGRKR